LFFNKMKPKYSKKEKIYDFDTKETIERVVVELPGAGCEWAKRTGGCTMCGFKFATRKYTRGKSLPSALYVGLVKGALNNCVVPKQMWIYNGGSFLNNKEIPNAAQLKIIKMLAEKCIGKIVVESRPEYITESKLQEYNKHLDGSQLVIGIGLECQNDVIRNKNINKGVSKAQYEKSISIARSFGAKILTYIFLKPIGLTEKEAVIEAIESARYCFDVGSDYIALETAFIQEGTEMHSRYIKGKYELPWLWSVAAVIAEINKLGPCYLGGFDDQPPPIAIASNCDKCNDVFMHAFNEYVQRNNMDLLNNLNCECRSKWELLD